MKIMIKTKSGKEKIKEQNKKKDKKKNQIKSIKKL